MSEYDVAMYEKYEMDVSKLYGKFVSFGDFFEKAELNKYVIRAYPTDDYTIYKRIVGVFPYKDEWGLIAVDAENTMTLQDLEDRAKSSGVEIIRLSDILNRDGFNIFVDDQFDEILTKIEVKKENWYGI